MHSNESSISEASAKTSALHYEGAQEPRISAWAALGVASLILAMACYAFRLAHG
jgi:hypothetical protein